MLNPFTNLTNQISHLLFHGKEWIRRQDIAVIEASSLWKLGKRERNPPLQKCYLINLYWYGNPFPTLWQSSKDNFSPGSFLFGLFFCSYFRLSFKTWLSSIHQHYFLALSPSSSFLNTFCCVPSATADRAYLLSLPLGRALAKLLMALLHDILT